VRKVARLGVYCSFVAIGLAALSFRSAYGDVKYSALEMGRELGQLDDVGPGRPLMLNGQPVHIRSSTEQVPVGTVLDAVEERCRRSSVGLAEALDDLPALAKKDLPQKLDGQAASAVITERSYGRGMVACLVREDGAPARSLGDSVERLARFAESGDLSQVGSLRYLYAEATENGETHMVSVWTDGVFDLGAFAPEKGDAPGSDLDGVPRPEGSHRMLTAGADGVPYSVRLYRAVGSPQQVFGFFDQELPRRGWTLTFRGDRRVYEIDGVDLFVSAQPDHDGSIYTLVVMQGR
jgi:hypothetical protein